LIDGLKDGTAVAKSIERVSFSMTPLVLQEIDCSGNDGMAADEGKSDAHSYSTGRSTTHTTPAIPAAVGFNETETHRPGDLVYIWRNAVTTVITDSPDHITPA